MVDISGFAKVPLQLVWKVARSSALDASACDESLSQMRDMLLEDMEKLQTGLNALLLKEMWASLDHLHSALLMQARGSGAAATEYFRLARDNARLAFGVTRDLHWRTLATKVSMIACIHIHADDRVAAKHLCCRFLQTLYSFDASAESLAPSANGPGGGGGGGSSGGRGGGLSSVLKKKSAESAATKGEAVVSLRSAAKHALGLCSLATELLDRLPSNDRYAQTIYQTVTEINEWLLFSAPLPDARMLVPTLSLGGENGCLRPAAWYAQLCRAKQQRRRRRSSSAGGELEAAAFAHRETVFTVLAGGEVDRGGGGGGENDGSSPCFLSVSGGRIRYWALPSVPRDKGEDSACDQEGAAAMAAAAHVSVDGCTASVDLAADAFQVRVDGKKTTLAVQDRLTATLGRSVCVCGDAVYALCSPKGAPSTRTWLCGWLPADPSQFMSIELGDVFDKDQLTPTLLIGDGALGLVAIGFKSGDTSLYYRQKRGSPSPELDKPIAVKSNGASAAGFMQLGKSGGSKTVLLLASGSKVDIVEIPDSSSRSSVLASATTTARVMSLCTDQSVAKEWSGDVAALFMTGCADRSVTVWRLGAEGRSVERLATMPAAALPTHLSLCYPRLLSVTRDTERTDRANITFWQVDVAAAGDALLARVTDVDEDTAVLSATLTSHGKLLTSSQGTVLLW